ncbi:MAG TPA: ABC transporter permease [Sinomonas sp.]|nr:ABC transporter permease [Sinomonas sp.]
MSTSVPVIESAAPEAVEQLAHPAGLLRRLLKRPLPAAAALLFALIVVAAVVGPLLVGDPNAYQAGLRLHPPTGGHPFGTDNLGRDVFTRVLYGARASLLVGALTCAIAMALGTIVGILASMFRSVDLIVMRIVDGVMSFPVIVLALALMAILGSGLPTVIAAMVIVFFPGITRVVRSTALVIADLPMIDSARAVGASHARIFARYVLPHCLTPILIQGAIVFTNAVLVESALSFIGAGLPPDVPSWGAALAESRSYLSLAWWMWAFPGLALISTVLSVNVVVDAARDLLDPREAKN